MASLMTWAAGPSAKALEAVSIDVHETLENRSVDEFWFYPALIGE